ncbi:unnamed protein product [Arctogadus glacialis]
MIRGLASSKPPGEMSAGRQRAGGTENGAVREVEEDGKKKEEAGGLRGGRSIAEEAGGERSEGESGRDGNSKAAGGGREQVVGGEAVDRPSKTERKYERRLTVCVEQCGDVIPIGHYARECTTGVAKCQTCRRRERDCVCPVEEEAEEDGGEPDSGEPGAPDDGGGEDEEGENEDMDASMDQDGDSRGEDFPSLLEEELTSGQSADLGLKGELSEGLPRRQGDRSVRGRGGKREGVRMFGDGTGKTVLKMTWGNDEVGESGDFVDETVREGGSGSDMDMEELREGKKRLSVKQKTEGSGKKYKDW